MEADILAYLRQKEFPTRPYSRVRGGHPLSFSDVSKRTFYDPSLLLVAGQASIAVAPLNCECRGCDRCRSIPGMRLGPEGMANDTSRHCERDLLGHPSVVDSRNSDGRSLVPLARRIVERFYAARSRVKVLSVERVPLQSLFVPLRG